MSDRGLSVDPDVQERSVRVAFVHEWLTNLAGSEKCLLEMMQAFPNHSLYTSVLNEQVFPGLRDNTHTSVLQRFTPMRRSHLRALPLMALAMRLLRIESDHDLVIRSFHSFATLPPAPLGMPELVYCYTPPRFLYRSEALSREGVVVRAGIRTISPLLRRSDRRRVRRARSVVAISTFIADRVAKVYGVKADVVHPPVDVERFRAGVDETKDDYFVLCSRLVPYKRPDIAIEAFRSLPHRLIVVGSGRMRPELERTAPPNVSFAGWVPDDELPALLGRARGFVFPAEEDFGLAPVEALAAGTPVIALGRGGALDYVQDGKNGFLISQQTPPAFAEGVRNLTSREWNSVGVAATAAHFSPERFRAQIQQAALQILQQGSR